MKNRTAGLDRALAPLIVLLVAGSLMWVAPRNVFAAPGAYVFTLLASLGGAAPGGGSFTFDFEPTGINARGDSAFTADLTTGGEGVFVARQGTLSQIMRHGQAAPGGGVFSTFELGRLGFNDGGDVAIPFTLEPPNSTDIGLNAGVYRFSQGTQVLSVVARPGTPAPGGGTFQGVYFNTGLNYKGDIVFTGLVTGADISSGPPGDAGIGAGLFLGDKRGVLFNLVRPGDPAPGGGVFDAAFDGWINDGGDAAFGGHVQGEECINIDSAFVCGESLYLRDGGTGVIQSIAHQGSPAPGGGIFRMASGGVVNNRGDVVFIGDLTPAPAYGLSTGIFLYSKGSTIAVAGPGDAMPGGGTFVTASTLTSTYHLNNRGDVSFAATLNTDDDTDGIPDTGLYVSSKGTVQLVARTGTVIPGIGTISYLGLAALSPTSPIGTGGIINDSGDVLFFATLTNGSGVLLKASAKGI